MIPDGGGGGTEIGVPYMKQNGNTRQKTPEKTTQVKKGITGGVNLTKMRQDGGESTTWFTRTGRRTCEYHIPLQRCPPMSCSLYHPPDYCCFWSTTGTWGQEYICCAVQGRVSLWSTKTNINCAMPCSRGNPWKWHLHASMKVAQPVVVPK